MDIFYTHYQHSHSDQEERLAYLPEPSLKKALRFPTSLRLWVLGMAVAHVH